MKLGFDAQPLVHGQKTGIGYYQAGLIHHMMKLFPGEDYTLFYFSLRGKAAKRSLLKAYEGASLEECGWMSASLYKLFWTFIPVPNRLFFKKKQDLSHFFNYHIPPGVPGKKVCTVHDMTYKAFPETVRFKTKVMLDLNLKSSIRRADLILTDSEFSKSEIIKYFPQSAHKLEVVYCGVDREHFKPAPPEEIQRVRSKYGIEGKYFLYLGTLEPRKNLERLIQAYALLKERLPSAPRLVIAGGKGWMYEAIVESGKAVGTDCLFTGYVPAEDAPPLLSGCTAFLFPSLYEGFGMPPLEAMSCGAPVLTSNAASLPEVVGDAAVLVDPFSIESMYEGMLSLASDSGLRKSLSEKGLKRAEKFSWEAAAKALMELYKRILK